MPELVEQKDLIVRVALPEDIDGLVEMNTLFNAVEISPAQLAQRMQDPCCVETAVVALLKGKVIGFAALRIVPCLFYPDPHGEITELFVLASYRQQGVAKKLIDFAENLARQKNVRELFILVNPYNIEAISFYRKLGYHDNDVALSKILD